MLRRWTGLQVAYQVIGDRPLDLVYLTGTISNVDMRWEDPASARFLEGLASFSRVIVFDRRGVGASDRLTPVARFRPGRNGPRTSDARPRMLRIRNVRRCLLLASTADTMADQLRCHCIPSESEALILFNALGNAPGYDDDSEGQMWSDFVADFEEQFWGTKEYVPAVAPSVDARSGADCLVGQVHEGDCNATRRSPRKLRAAGMNGYELRAAVASECRPW